MYATYRMNVNELDERFLETLRTMFHNREIEISVADTVDRGEEETAHLLRSPANREHLLKAIEEVNHGRNLVTVDPDKLG